LYRPVHIGNLRSFLLGDLIRRALMWTGVGVRQVMNITDVGHMTDEVYDRGEDKMLLAAADEGLARRRSRPSTRRLPPRTAPGSGSSRPRSTPGRRATSPR